MAAIRLRMPTKPSSVEINAWALIDHWKRPVGPGMAVPYSLVERPRRSAWDARFSTGMPCRHYYVSVHATWTRQDSPTSYGEAGWRFHYVDDLAAGSRRLDCTA